MLYSLALSKENFKFSSSHFTIFSKESAEHLHGHNYQVSMKALFDSVDPQTEMAMDFKTIKQSVREICDKLDEKILIAKKSTFLKITQSPHYKKHTVINYNDRYYCFPDDEIFYVPAANITSEALAKYFHDELKKTLPNTIKKLIVSVRETSGQSAAYTD